MPELPEVETTVRGLEHVLKGRRIAARRGAAGRTCAGRFPPTSASG